MVIRMRGCRKDNRKEGRDMGRRTGMAALGLKTARLQFFINSDETWYDSLLLVRSGMGFEFALSQ